MNSFNQNRRDWMAGVTVAALGCGIGRHSFADPKPAVKPKSVAAIITIYQKGQHGDAIAGKILEGWKQDGGPGPALTLASMYVEQFTPKDISRELARKYNMPMFDSIEQAVTVGGNSIPVDGVLSIGEHGDYPVSDIGQLLYPRRRFFKEITDTFQKYKRVVPVFNDKHLGPIWADGKWMYDRAQAMKVPFMAGSSVPVSFREPEIDVPMGCEIEAAVGIGYSHLDKYGFHSLECFQCLAERRRGAETGVQWVQCLQGDAMWKTLDEGLVSKELFDAALPLVADPSDQLRKNEQAALFLFQYLDGLLGAVFMLPGFARGISVALKLKGQKKVLATKFEERLEPRLPHFAYLLKGIERMIHTGRPSYPVERTLLTGGILDRALTSRSQQQTRLMTPELAIRYQPVEYPHAPQLDLNADPTGA